MSLMTQLAGDFDGTTRQRGADYFRNGRVRIDTASASRIVATVRGTTPYRVDLEREDREIRASCTCPYFDVALCKHIWAVIMAPETQRLLQGMGHNGGVELVRREVEDDDLDEDDGYAEDGPPYPRSVTARAFPPTRHPSARHPHRLTAASWRNQIAQLHPVPGYLPARETWPSQRELLYVIDVANTLTGSGLHLEIFFRDLKKSGDWSKPKSRYLRRELLHQLPDVSDRRILPFSRARANSTTRAATTTTPVTTTTTGCRFVTD